MSSTVRYVMSFDAKSLMGQLTQEECTQIVNSVMTAMVQLAREYIAYPNPPDRDSFIELHSENVYLDLVMGGQFFAMAMNDGDMLDRRWRFTELLSTALDNYFDPLVASLKAIKYEKKQHVTSIAIARITPHQLTLLVEAEQLHEHHWQHAKAYLGSPPGWP